ncbi:hypothetical protein DNU06_07950 [Putridiphycobacter roseus]|uniref:Secretion system C-terminal sorting domain-containing protein n=1 Tax=Putridiphycobacter roseus TaxID=2219161 RepID=A0A2W1MZ66_9FLAO|nr:T9SS type A sorting domain-containing protein [Putridiphycobacter roseus]PZE17197.1 hypothetical protein DNU06_07950 [Putridiphycobacter roseus]
MKNLLLLTAVLVTSASFGQKTLFSVVHKQIDALGTVVLADSTAYGYTSTPYLFNEFKPKFGFSDDYMNIFVEDQLVHANTKDVYYYDWSNVLYTAEAHVNILSNGLITTSENTIASNRTLYTYTPQGKKAMVITQSYDGTSWNNEDSTIFNYDALGNKIYRAEYHFNAGSAFIDELDSLTYQAGTSNLTQSSTYKPFMGNLEANYRSTITWVNGKVDKIDLFSGAGPNAFLWKFRMFYQYSGNLVSTYDLHPVYSNIVSTNIFESAVFTFNQQNDPLTFTSNTNGVMNYSFEYIYDNEGFLNQMKRYYYNHNDSVVELGDVTDYNFANVASVEQVSTLNIVLYPNPTTDFLHIQSETAIERLQIVNINGQTMLTQNNSNDVDVSHLSKGTYIIYGNAADKSFKQTFIKE